MLKTNKNKNKEQEKTVNQPSLQTPSILSNYKWYFVSFSVVIFIAFVVQYNLNKENNRITEERLFTVDELQTYTKDELYLAILGHVFNVSSAPKFYSSTGSYKFYTGRDASRSYHTGGTSNEDLVDDLTGLNDEDITGVYHWLEFYKKQYQQIGKLIGRYFDSSGTPTEHFHNVLKSVEIMKKKNEEKALFEQKWPPCNSEWSHATGKRVWCSEKSGGIERKWIGVPRRYFDSTIKSERCVCVENDSQLDGKFKQYKNCPPTSTECQILD